MKNHRIRYVFLLGEIGKEVKRGTRVASLIIPLDFKLIITLPFATMAQDSQEAAVVRPVADILEQRNAGNSSGYILPKLHSMKEQNPNLALLDIGCGPGTISSTLAKIIPDGHVTGIDKSPDIIPRARDLAEESGVKNIEFQQGDAYKLPFADGAFDITICHQMLTYLKAPWDALSEMIRVTKVGGIIAAREGDLTSECVWPELPGLVKFHKLAGDLIKGGGGTDKGGRQLLSWALKAGVKREMITVSHSTWSYSTPKEKQIWCMFFYIEFIPRIRVYH